MKINHKKSSRKILLSVTVAAVLFVIFLGGYLFWNSTKSNDQNIQNGVDYSAATDEDKVLNDEYKSKLPATSEKQKPETSTTEDGKKAVTPVISAWGQPGGMGTDLKINGYVPEIIEANGSCTITLTKGPETVSTSKTALQNAQNTSCGQLVIPYAQLSPGTWQAVLSYNSPMSAGSSIKTEIEVR